MGFFGSQGQVTPKWIVWSRQNSNSSKNLWLPRIPASLMKIRSKFKALLIGQGQIWAFFFCHSRARKSEVDSPIWPEFELIQGFMAVLVTCKTDEDPIKSEVPIYPDNIFSSISLWKKNRRSRASNSKVNCPIWPEIELVRDYIDVLVTCKFDKAPITNEVVIDRTTFSPL